MQQHNNNPNHPTTIAVANAAKLAPTPFENSLKQLAHADELPDLRSQTTRIVDDLANAVDKQDYAAAACLRDDLAELRARDPAAVADDLRAQLERLVKREAYDDAARLRDQLLVLRRFQPQYQLAGLWKGNYPNHGDAYVRLHYAGDELFATKVTGDEHVPAGEITFRADLTAPCADTPPTPRPDAPDELVGVRVEVISVGSDGTSEQRAVERFEGEGRIAARGFKHDHYVPGQLFLMDTDVIGFLWAPLGIFVVFSRVEADELEEEGHAEFELELLGQPDEDDVQDGDFGLGLGQGDE